MALFFDTSIQYLKGVGPKLGQILGKYGIHTVGDLILTLPRAYEDRRRARNISSLQPGELVSLVANIVRVSSVPMGRKGYRKIYEVLVSDGTGRLPCKYFRVPYKGYFERFLPGMKVKVTGKVVDYRGRIQMSHPDIHGHDETAEGEADDEIIPLYSDIDGISSTKFRKLIEIAIHQVLDKKEELSDVDIKLGRTKGIPDPLPKTILSNCRLMGLEEALLDLHQPKISDEKSYSLYSEFSSKAHQRLIFDEFFFLELHLAKKRLGLKKLSAIAMKPKFDLINKVKSALPFQLTGAQDRALSDIVKDLERPHPMHRMVQGDVGCGKTLVGLLACVNVIENGFQTAFMAPTEILAEQHFKNAKEILEPLGLKVGFLVGSLSVKDKAQVYQDLESGKIDLVIGTHALIQDKVNFKSLSLTIIDEQHRFGVGQRGKLKDKSMSPHFLVMTATPIPRSLAMTVYGDLDVSVIDEKPKGRIPIVTRKAFESKRDKVMPFFFDQIRSGRQGYIVYPLVEESEKLELKNAITEQARMVKAYPEFSFGLLHGKMKSAEKDLVMRQFRDGEIQVLVATTVIEVGVDVPNANIMLIEHSERFGLSQLHQLRGRVGRGDFKSYCVLMLAYARSEVATQRAEIMEKSNDGFFIAEKDLEIRGPGEFLGRRQSGLSGFKYASLVRDQKALQEAKKAAFDLVKADPGLQRPENAQILAIYKKNLEILVG